MGTLTEVDRAMMLRLEQIKHSHHLLDYVLDPTGLTG